MKGLRRLSTTPAADRWKRLLVALVMAGAIGGLVASAAGGIFRRGYSLDEELTTLAARGINLGGLPTLPSGVLYERGLPYSYAAAAASRLLGVELPAYRIVSLILGALAVGAMYEAGFALEKSRLTGITASLLLALFPGLHAASSWARFYTFAALTFAAALAIFLSKRDQRLSLGFPLLVLLASLVHEAGFLLASLPVITLVQRGERRVLAIGRLAGPVIFALAVGRLLLLALNFAVPDQSVNPWLAQSPIGDAALQIPGWQLLHLPGGPGLLAIAVTQCGLTVAFARATKCPILFLLPAAACAAFFQLGMLVWWVAVACLLFTERARATIVHGCISLVSALAAWFLVLHARGFAPDVASFGSLVGVGLIYPMDAVRFVVLQMPVTTLLLLLAGALTILARASPVSRGVRLVLCLIALYVLALSVLDVGFAVRYLLVIAPAVVLALALIPSLLETTLWPLGMTSVRSLRFRGGSAIVLLGLVFLDWRAFASPRLRAVVDTTDLAAAAATGAYPDPTLTPGRETIVTNDELASAFNLGRADYWYLEAPGDLDQYRLNTPSGPRGLYAGASLLTNSASLRQQIDTCARNNGCLLAVFRTGRFPSEAFEQASRQALADFGGAEVRRSAALTLVRIPPGRASR